MPCTCLVGPVGGIQNQLEPPPHIAVVSGALVSLLFGLTAVLTGAGGYQLPEVSRIAILAVLVFFVVAAIGGIVTNLPRSYRGVTAEALKKQIDERWEDSAAAAQREVALTELNVIRRAKGVEQLRHGELVGG
jgi:hypothetical protein